VRRTFSRLSSLGGEKGFILPELARRREGLYLAWTRSTARRTLSCLNSLDDEKNFILPELTQRREGLSLASTRSTARRTLSCLNSLNGEKDFILPELAQRREGLYLAWTRSTERRTLSGASTCPGCTSPPPWMHWGLFLFLASKRTRALRSLIVAGASDRWKTMRTLKL